VTHLEARGGCPGAEVLALDQRGAESAQRSLACRSRSGRAAAHYQYVVFTPSELRKISMHLFLSVPRALPAAWICHRNATAKLEQISFPPQQSAGLLAKARHWQQGSRIF
jgi:hypothetical protein